MSKTARLKQTSSRQRAKIVRGFLTGFDLEHIDTNRQFLLDYACIARSEFPESYREMLHLIAELSEGTEEEDFRIRLSKIVDRHRRRLLKNPKTGRTYVHEIEACIRAIDQAVQALESAIHTFAGLDRTHREILAYVTNRIGIAKFWTQDPHPKLAEIRWQLELLQIAIKFATGISGEKHKRGRRPDNFAEAARDLMALWQGYTDQVAVVPAAGAKGAGGGREATQASTRFVQLGLSMISEKATFAKARTAISLVQKLEKQLGDRDNLLEWERTATALAKAVQKLR